MIQEMIINQLLINKEYRSTVAQTILEVSHIFKDHNHRNIIDFIKMFYEDRKVSATKDDLLMYLENNTTLNEKDYLSFKSTLKDITSKDYELSMEVLKSETLNFIKDNLTMILLEKSADVLNGMNRKESFESIQLDMRKIVDMSFDEDIGIFLEDTEQFHDYGMNKTPLGFAPTDELLSGGIPESAMVVILGGSLEVRLTNMTA